MGKSYVAHCMNGYYQYDRFVHVHEGLRYHPYAQCGMIHEKGSTLFVSYETIVCEVDKDGWFNLRGEYSTTTSKQITWFLREWMENNSHRRDLCNYRYIRDKYRKGIDVNLWNGDEREHINGVEQKIGIKH